MSSARPCVAVASADSMCNTSQQVWHTSEVDLGLTEGLDMKGAGLLSTEALGVPGFTGSRTVNVEPLPTNQVI